jgi:hypothetical protein
MGGLPPRPVTGLADKGLDMGSPDAVMNRRPIVARQP